MSTHPAQHILDLTHPLSSDIPSFDGNGCFMISNVVDYKDCTPPNLFRVQRVEAKTGAGTHIDAPAHCFPDAKTVDALDLRDLVTHCVVIQVDSKADENYIVTPDVIDDFEKEHGKIPPDTFVIFFTGWEKYWNAPAKYRNNLRFPSIHPDTANLLLERSIAGLGTDTLSADAGGKDFPVHRLILGSGKYLVENIAHAKDMPPMGAKIAIMPMKIKGGTESPVRIIAFMPDQGLSLDTNSPNGYSKNHLH